MGKPLQLSDFAPAQREAIRAQLARQPRVTFAQKPLLTPGAQAGLAEKRSESPLESLFMRLWEECKGESLKREVMLVPGRKWRTDFLHEKSRVCVEVNGYQDHASRKGFARDNAKHFAIQLLGYQIFTLDRPMLTLENIALLVEFTSEKALKNQR